MKIALVKDITRLWTLYKPELEKHGTEVVLLDVFKRKDYDRLFNEKWDGLIWRAKHDPYIRDLAKRIIYFFNVKLGVKTFPDWNSYWFYDDKIAQTMIFQKHGIATPNNYVFFNKEDALEFAETTEYPIVSKASSGAGSANVRLIKNKRQAKKHIKQAFGKGIKTFFVEDLQRKYVYFQEFLKNNNGDYRIVVLGNERMFGFYRANKDGSKFASGSGIIEYEKIPEDLLKFVYNVHKQLEFPMVMSYDIMKNNSNNWVVGEISTIYGDLNSESIYKQAAHYLIKKDQITEHNVTDDIQRYFIKMLLKKWGWID